MMPSSRFSTLLLLLLLVALSTKAQEEVEVGMDGSSLSEHQQQTDEPPPTPATPEGDAPDIEKVIPDLIDPVDDPVPEPALQETKTKEGSSPDSTGFQCGLYLAESTVPDAGLGVFNGHHAKKVGDPLDRGDICIPLIDLFQHHGKKTQNPFKDYYWNGVVVGMAFESDRDARISGVCAGMGSVANNHAALSSAGNSLPSFFGSMGLHRSRDPGAGAFSAYHQAIATAERDLPAGGEIFKYYGNDWFNARTKVKGINVVPIASDYPFGQRLLKKLVGGVVLGLSSSRSAEPWQVDLYSLVQGISDDKWKSRKLNTLPPSLDDAEDAYEHDIATALQPAATRSVEWLEQHGRCVDHIRPDISTNPQAGWGAFATHDMPTGFVVSTSPVHHLADRDTFMPMFHFPEVRKYVPKKLRFLLPYIMPRANPQLLYNYCMSHPESSVMICPYGPYVHYVNHDKEKANVQIRWAEDFDIVHNSTRFPQYSIKYLAGTKKTLLAIEYVATRDIKEGDEIFLDYGASWEAAWKKHSAKYPKDNVKDYRDSMYWNSLDEPLRTSKEQQTNPYPKNVQMRCHRDVLKHRKFRIKPIDEPYEWSVSDPGEECSIVSKKMVQLDNQDVVFYTIRYPDWVNRTDVTNRTNVMVKRNDIPRSAIKFFDEVKTSDMHQPHAFRHYIEMPNKMVPLIWRDRDLFAQLTLAASVIAMIVAILQFFYNAYVKISEALFPKKKDKDKKEAKETAKPERVKSS